MVINAIEIKLSMVKTVAQCLKIKINQKFVNELWAANEGPVSH